MGAGVPVVAARAGALPETLGDAAVLVDPADVDALAAALDRVVHDDELRRDLVTAGCRRVEQYRWPNIAPRFVELYKSLA
jgi:glycosyltransferase involved in cell wall biosynthesis